MKETIESNNRSNISSVFLSEISNERLDEKYFDELLKMVLNSNVLEEYKTSAFIDPIEKDKSKWNERYIFKVETDLNQNFSKERIKHIAEVRKHLFEIGVFKRLSL